MEKCYQSDNPNFVVEETIGRRLFTMPIKLFVKFGEREHLERMRKEGILHCNTITYFSKVEDNNRGDPFEAVTRLEYFDNARIQLRPVSDPSAKWKYLNATNTLYQEYYEEPMGSLFCMSAFRLNPTKEISTFHIDERFLGFRYGLMIMRQDLFMERLKKALATVGFKTCMNTVEYFDLHKYSGPKNLFQKDKKDSWQEELRLILYTGKYKMIDPFEFSMGNIEDISEIIDLGSTKKLEYKLSL